MIEALTVLMANFWIGAVHAATPGHGKTIAAAYIVGARGKPIDALILGVFVTLSHTSGILIVGVLASLGLPGFIPQKIEAWLALVTGALVILIGLWTLWQQRALIIQLNLPAHLAHSHDPAHPHAHSHAGDGAHAHAHSQQDGEHAVHSHGWGMQHTHDLALVTGHRPSMLVLMGLGIAGGLLPDPAALGLLLAQLAQGKVMLGLAGVVIFSIGFAATLVLVGIVAAKVGERILDWLAGSWAMRLQIATSLLIIVVGVVLTFNAAVMIATLK